MQATHGAPVYRGDLSKAQAIAHNVDFNMFSANNYMMSRPPEYFVYLYNVSQQSFSISRPPLFREFIIRGRQDNERYTLATKLPQPLMVPKGNVDSNEVDMVPTDCRRIAMDIINPDNFGTNQDAVLDSRSITSQGNNLGAKGVFYSLNGPGASENGGLEEPTKDEIDAAYSRLEKWYTHKLDEARAMEVSNPADLSKLISPEHHAAADYYGEERPWHMKKSKPMDCPNCGDRIKQGAAFHKTDEGTFCIIDWRRAVAAGVRSRSQAFEATEDKQFAPVAVAPVAAVPTPAKEKPPQV